MKNLLFFLLLCGTAHAQISDVTVLPATLFVKTGTTTANLDLTSVVNTLNSQAVTITNHTEGIAAVNRRADAQDTKIQAIQTQVNNLPSGSGTPAGTIKPITGTSYTITAADNGNTLLFKTKCTVTFSGLTTGFKCSCHQEGGNITFSGTNPILNKFGYTRSQTVGAWVEVIVLPLGISLKGDLTK